MSDRKKYCGNYETLGNGIALKNAIVKYGRENFTRKIIEECETKDKLSKSIKEYHDFNGRNNPRANPVNQFSLNGDFIKRWNYAKEASQILNINYSSLISCCIGRYKSAGGYIWKYSNSN